jgi:orotate phosphoribosyltransferase
VLFNQEEFNQFIKENSIIKVFDDPIILKSGQPSTVYINWRVVAADAYLMNVLTNFVLAFAKQNNIRANTFYGVPEGATKLGVIVQFKYAMAQNPLVGEYALAMGRAVPKVHGDPSDTFFVGAPKGNICVLEDVTTTGGSLIKCVSNLKSMGHTVSAAIGLTNRNEFRNDGKTVMQALHDLGVSYYEMSNASDLMV